MEIVFKHRFLSFVLIYPIYNLFSRFRFVCANCPSRADIVCTKTKPKKCTSYDSKPFVKQKALFRTLIVRLHKLAGFANLF